MKVTKSQLKQIIKEELESTLKEGFPYPDPDYVQRKERLPQPSAEQSAEREARRKEQEDWRTFHQSNDDAEKLWNSISDYYYKNNYTYPDDLVDQYVALFPDDLQPTAKRLVLQSGH